MLKIPKAILNGIVWSMLSLYLLSILVFQIPAVQEFMGRGAAKVLSQKIGSDVRIGSIEWEFFNRLTLNDVCIFDQQGQEMLRAEHLSAHVDVLPLLEGRVSFHTAQLFSAHVRLYQATADAKPNFQFLLDSLASQDTTSSALDLRINSLIMRRSSISYDRYDQPETPDRLNPHHLSLTDISAHLVLKALTEDSLNINIKRFAFKEKSGLDIRRLSTRLEGNKEHCLLQNFTLRMPGTHFQLGDIEADYRFRGQHFVTPSLSYKGSIAPSTITLSDLSCLLPTLKTFNSTLQLSALFEGKGADLSVPNLQISSTTGDIELTTSGWLKGFNQKQPTWYADLNDLALSAKTINFISENLKGTQIDVPQPLVRLGNIHLRGSIEGRGLADIRTSNQLTTDAGSVALHFAMDAQRRFTGHIDTKGIDLQRLLDDDDFGQIATKVDVSGQLLAAGNSIIKADGLVHQLEYRGYNYQNIDINGTYSAKDINGKLNISDPNIDLQIEGNIDRTGQTHHVSLTAFVQNLSPKATHLSDQWDDARFTGNIYANFRANDINDAVGTLDVSDFRMHSPTTEYELNELHIASGYAEEIHYMTLQSDFAQAELKGHFNYETLWQSFTNLVADKLPTIPGMPKVNHNTRNNFSISAQVWNSDWMEKLLQIPMSISEPITLQGVVNDPTHHVDVQCDLPRFYYKDSGYRKGHISLSSPGDSLTCNLHVFKLTDDGNPMELDLSAYAYDNNLFTSFLWNNHAKELVSGQFNAKTNFMTDFNGQPTAYVSVQPSQFNLYNAVWTVSPCEIQYTDKHLAINHFSVQHEEQHLFIDGTASAHAADTLHVNLKDIDVEYVLDLVGFDAVRFSGEATGDAYVRGIFGDLQADADLTVSSFKFQDGRMGTLRAGVVWDNAEEQINIDAISDDGEDAMTYINGYVSLKRNYIDLAIRADGTHLDFAHSFTKSFIGHIDGHAQGAVNLVGPLSAVNLTGELVLNGSAHVSTLGCTYELRNDTLRCVPNEMEFVNCDIYDIYDHRATLTGGIHHKDLTRLTYDIYVNAENLLAYDFEDFGDDAFYGTVYATGQVAIRGRENEVLIEGNVTPLSNSVFVYNAANPDAINDQTFIEWGSAAKHPRGETAYHQPSASTDITEFRSDLRLRLRINATPDASLQLLMDERSGDYITLQGNGVLQANYYNKGGFQMFGTYRITGGTYDITIQDIIKKNFIFNEGGTIIFGGDPYDATLNLQAQYTVNGVSLSDLNVGNSFSNTVRVNCLMNITGQPKAPIVDFDLDLPNVNSDEKQMVRFLIDSEEEMNQQVVYLLAVGRFFPQGANNADQAEGQSSQTSLAMQSLLSGTLSGQINSLLGQVIKSNNWNFGANISTGDEGWNNAEYEGLISGRLFNNRLLIDGQFGYRDKAATANTTFIGDFDIRYLLLPNGNLALRVYNQTNDRYFTRNSLNTQGIGFIMKKDFSDLSELLGKKKKKRIRRREKSK